MKKVLQLSLIFLFAAVYGQNISDYQYIYIPKEFADSKVNKYNLDDLLAKKLKAKKFVIINDMIEFNCETLKAEIRDTSNFMKNKINVDFTDCHNKTVATLEGKSSIKDFESGMQEALEIATKTIPVSNPLQKNEITKAEIKVETKTETNAIIYSNGSLVLNKIFLSEGQFILADPNNSVAYATFRESTKKGVYRVQLSNGTQTLGYLEEEKIVVELPNSDGSFRKEIFTGK